MNQTAAIVFDLCDGGHSKSEMATAIQHRTGFPADESVVDLALDELVDAGLVLLDEPPQAGITRRALIRRLSLSAAAAALLPVVETISLTPVAAADTPHPPLLSQLGPSSTGVPPPRGRPTATAAPSTGVPPPRGRPTAHPPQSPPSTGVPPRGRPTG